MSQELTLVSKTEIESAKKIDTAVSQLLNSGLTGFALLKAKTKVVSLIKEEFKKDKEFVKDVMSLQGEQFGFKTDCKKGEVYPEETVLSALVSATLKGVEPTDNQFNILGGNCYITKNGVSHILKNRLGVHPDISYSLSKEIDGITTITTTIEWVRDGKAEKKIIVFPIKVYKGVTTEDAIRGKAERKAKAWLIEHITGMEVGDGEQENTVDGGYAQEVKDTTTASLPVTVNVSKQQQERFDKHIQKATTLSDLETKVGEVCKGFKLENMQVFNLDMYNHLKEQLKDK